MKIINADNAKIQSMILDGKQSLMISNFSVDVEGVILSQDMDEIRREVLAYFFKLMLQDTKVILHIDTIRSNQT